MGLNVKEAKYLHGYVIWVRFNDGAEGEVDLEDELDGEMFKPLKDPALFRRFRVHPLFQTHLLQFEKLKCSLSTSYG